MIEIRTKRWLYASLHLRPLSRHIYRYRKSALLRPFQDSWRISSRDTINLGVRYELHRPTTERFDRFNNFNYSVANPLGPLVGLPLRGGLVFPRPLLLGAAV